MIISMAYRVTIRWHGSSIDKPLLVYIHYQLIEPPKVVGGGSIDKPSIIVYKH